MAYMKYKPRRKFNATKKYKRYANKYPKGRRIVNKLGKFTDSGLPESMFMKLKYVARRVLTGAPSSQYFSGNDISMCDVTGITGQPYNADQLCSLYSRWVVTSSKIKIKCINNAQGGSILVRPALTTGGVTDYSLEASRPDVRDGLVTARESVQLRHFETSKNVFGLRTVTDDTSYDGTASSTGPTGGPVVKWYWLVSSIGSDNLTTDMDIHVEIEYYVKCFRRLSQGSSS